MRSIIIDSNIAAKLFTDEPDSIDAVELMESAIKHKSTMLVPELFKYEITAIAYRKRIPLKSVLVLFDEQIDKVLNYIKPSTLNWLEAAKIALHGTEKSGYPDMYDSIYHALAINHNGVFITADEKHYAKTKDLGSIVLLKDWRRILTTQH